MIKVVGLLKRKHDMKVEEFQRHWREVQGPSLTKTPGIRRYIQSHALPETYEGGAPPAYDGLDEIWFESLEAFESARQSSPWQTSAASAQDFTASVESLITREIPIVDAFASPQERSSMVKYVSFLTRKEGMSVEDFQKHWRDVHAPLIVAELTRMRRYVQCHPLPETYSGGTKPPYDGIPMAWYSTLEDGRPTRAARPDGERPPPSPMIADAANFMAGGRLPSMIAREVTVLD